MSGWQIEAERGCKMRIELVPNFTLSWSGSFAKVFLEVEQKFEEVI